MHLLKPNATVAGIVLEDLEDLENYDIFQDKKGNLYVRPKDGSGPGEPLNINIHSYGI